MSAEPRMTLRDRVVAIVAGNRKMMRYCAERWRAARRANDAEFMARWLELAVNYRRLNDDYRKEVGL